MPSILADSEMSGSSKMSSVDPDGFGCVKCHVSLRLNELAFGMTSPPCRVCPTTATHSSCFFGDRPVDKRGGVRNVSANREGEESAPIFLV